jgi:hypothetical protein
VPVAVDLARRQWEDADRRVHELAPDAIAYDRVLREIEAVTEELRRRVGATFSLAELADAYDAAEGWSREAIGDRVAHPTWPRTASLATDAAFHLYARGATDYRP